MDQAFDAIFQFNERAVVRDVGHAARELGADRVFRGDAIPRIGRQLFHAERDTLRVRVDLDDLDFDFLADFHDLRRVRDALPAHVGDVQQAIDAAEVHERAVIGDVLDDALATLALGHVADDLGALFRTALFEHGAARDDDVAARTVHLEDGERLHLAHERADVADRTDVDLDTRQEGVDAAEVDGEAAFDAADDRAFDGLFLLVHALEAGPGFFTLGLVARQHSVAERVLDALEVDFDDGADRGLRLVGGEFRRGCGLRSSGRHRR